MDECKYQCSYKTGMCNGDLPPCAVEAIELATEAAKEKVTSTGNDYAKCADDILALDCVDAVINKRGVLVAILKRHFA